MSDLADDLAARPRRADRNDYDRLEPASVGSAPADTGIPPTRSLVEDMEALVDDARTYVDAELSYQKSRASFVTDRVKRTLIFAVGAATVGLLAAIGLTVGLIIALTPLVTGWGATAIVVGLLLLVAYLLISRASKAWGDIQRVTGSKANGRASDEG